MPLAIGDRLGPYEILAPIGKGGMGEVWKARDTKLGRDVALKSLPAAFASDPDRMARFEREARVLASLDHPNIAAIYGLEESDGVRALVLALIDGPTLADRIAAGPIPLDEAIQIARQIADAVEYAHERGVINRDLKPANIKLTSGGMVKVLDFGLAKALDDEPVPGSGTNSPTLTMGATRAGVLLGTAAYMSPEQAKGKQADRRSDIWSFGAVLYEMVTGKPPFSGETIGDTLASVIKDEPKLDAVPAEVRSLVGRCLNKDSRQRLQAIGEGRIALENPMPAKGTKATPAQRKQPWAGITAGVLGVALLGTCWVAWRLAQPIQRQLVRYGIDLGADTPMDASLSAAVSPDGNRLVYPVRGPNGAAQLATRRLDEANATVLRDTEGGTLPFFSPDGQWVGFFANFKLKKVSLQGGAPVPLCDVPVPLGASWGEDGNIVTTLNAADGLYRISAEGGTPQSITKVGLGDITHRWPQVLPGAKAVLFTTSPAPLDFESARIEVLSLVTGERKTLIESGYFGRYVPSSRSTGHLLYVRDGTLYAVAFNPVELILRGKPVPILDEVAADPRSGGVFDFSRSGDFYYRSGKTISNKTYPILWLDHDGKTTPLLAKPGAYFTPRFSPDGKTLALVVAAEGLRNIFIYDWQNSSLTRLSAASRADQAPVWAPDGRHIAFMSIQGKNAALLWSKVDGGEAQTLLQSENLIIPYSFSPDGKRLVYVQAGTGRVGDIWILPLDLTDPDHPKAGGPVPFLRTPAIEAGPAFSPDGRWIAYHSNESGRFEVYVRPASADPSGSGPKWQISNGGAVNAVWSRDGRQLFFETLSHERRLAVTDVTMKDGSFATGPEHRWTDVPFTDPEAVSGFDLHPDGKRFAVFAAAPAAITADTGSAHLFVLLHFFDELRRRVPVTK